MINYKKIKSMFKLYLFILTGWLIILPLTYLIRLFYRNKIKYIVFIGRDKGLFVDNVKYLYNYFYLNRNLLKGKNLEFVFITEDKQTYNLLKKNKLPVVIHPSFKSIKLLILSKLLIVDNLDWYRTFKFFLLYFSKKIQLWHGVGFKYIELQNKKDSNFKTKKSLILSKLRGRYPKYDIVISTSDFYAKHVFSKAFDTKEIWITGYPRNDIFFRDLTKYDLIFTDLEALEAINTYKSKGYKIILYAPTFRDTGGHPISKDAIYIKEFNPFLEKIKTILVIKLHPLLKINQRLFTEYKNIIFYKSSRDIYPLLKQIDCLITDYSSLYMDFLLLDKPIIFYPYDFEKYINKDRELQFDYNWITPGRKVYTQDELKKALVEILVNGIDNYKKERQNIRNLAFKYQDGLASKRIFDKILQIL